MSNRILHFPSLDVRSVIYLLDPSGQAQLPFTCKQAARDPEHSLQALGQEEGLPKPGKDLTGQEGQLGLESVDTGTVFDQGDGTGAANDWVPGIQLPWGLISSILEGLGMIALRWCCCLG